MATVKFKIQVKELDTNKMVIVPVVERKTLTKKQQANGEKPKLAGDAAKFWKDQPGARLQIGFDHPDQHKAFEVGKTGTITLTL